jgi:acetylornithine deacetylase/succinyl-diaminopimelate desuccinylase-like protein
MREAFGTVAYGIWPCRTTPLEVFDDAVHNVNERIHSDDLVYATRFHLHVVREMGAPAR